MYPLDICEYLLVVLILLPGSNPRSLNADQSRRKNGTAEEGTESFPSLKELDNFVDGQCPPRANSLNINGIDGACKYECSTDIDCSEDYKCCESGCSFVCTEPWFPKRVVDWAKSSSLNQISDDPALANERNEIWKSRGEPCSTSVLDGLQPLRCPSNYVCQITMDEDIQLNIPNRGECVRINEKKPITGITENANHPDFSTLDTVCSHQGETYKHKEQFRKDCNVCVCHNGVVFCDNRPCPVKIGNPGTVSSYEEHRHKSRYQYISVDNEELDDKNDTSNSSGSDEDETDEDGQEEIRNDGYVRLIDGKEVGSGDEERGDQSEAYSGDNESKSQEREEDISGDDAQAHWREVNSRDKEEVNSGDEPQSRDNNQAFGGESGSAEIETEESERTKPTTTTHEPGILISVPETSTLAAERSTLTPKPTTLGPTTSILTSKIFTFAEEPTTLAAKTSTLVHGIEQKQTTESSRLQQIEPTEGIIRLGKSDYEPSGYILGKYSGDNDEEGSSREHGSSEGVVSGSADEPSSEETEQPESVYPGTIVLGKYVQGANQEAEFGVETGHPRFDTVNDGSPKTNENQETEERSGDGGSASGEKKDTYKRKGKKSEYFATTDDEH